MLINAGINLSKIKKEAVKKSEKTGDNWINVTIRLHSEDKYGNCLSIKQYTGDKEEHLYLGNGKIVVFKEDYNSGDTNDAASGETKDDGDDDGLPF